MELSYPTPYCTHPSCCREAFCRLNSPHQPFWRNTQAIASGKGETCSRRASRREAVWEGHLEARSPGRVAWGSSLLSHRRMYHHWTQGFLVSLETLSTCVGVKVGRVKISFISYKKNSPLCKCLQEPKPLLSYYICALNYFTWGFAAFSCRRENCYIF